MAENIQHLEELLLNNPPGTELHKECLKHLANWYGSKFYRTDDISDIEEFIKYGRLSLNANSSDLRRVYPFRLLFRILLAAFERTSKISYLDELITVGYEILKLHGLPPSFPVIESLVSSLLTRDLLLGQPEDPHEAMRFLSSAIDSQ
jgi:hypothetical protein